jgi:S1-C subfamily serine protease
MPVNLRIFGVGLAMLAWLSIESPAAERQPRYAALLANGQRLTGEKLTDWHDKNALPRLDGQPLLEPSNSFRWIRDRSLPLADLPAAYVELAGGDRFPGAVVDYRTGLERPYQALPPHLVVRSTQSFEAPENRPVGEIRIVLASVRRIVWQRRGRQPYQPGTALYRDGRSVKFRAVRLHKGEAHLLLQEGGDRRIRWSDLAELHFPEADPWSALYDELVQLCPNLETRLFQVETTAGLIATASLARFVPRFEGNSAESDRWSHGIQPAWSLDILWIPCREIVYRRSWLPREVPLVRLPVRTAGASNPAVASSNRNSLGGPLRSQTFDFGWGWGVHGRSTLAFDLPAAARHFRTQMCLDRSAGRGGCVLARVYVNEPAGNPLWQSPLMVGSEGVADSGGLALTGPAGGQKQLVLAIDPVEQGRPAGADPLDIRDHANWCDPLLELDPALLQVELDSRLSRRFLAWKEWEAKLRGAANVAEAGLEMSMQRDERRPVPGTFHPAIQVKNKPLVLTRRMTIGPDDNWLLIGASRPFNRGQEPKIEVFLGGEAVAEFAVPERQHDADENRPLAIPLAAYQQTPPATIEVELRQQALADSAPVEYRLLEVARQTPTLYQLFEEQGDLAAVDPAAGGTATIASDQRHFGVRSIKLTPGGEFRLPLPEIVRVRERPTWGEYRFLRFAARKQGGGRLSLGMDAADFRQNMPRYDAGQGQPVMAGATRVWGDLPKEWVVITRDLYADFGNVDLKGLLVGCPDGEAAWFDHIYLGRGHYDLDRIPAAPSAEATNEKAAYELAKPAIDRARPATLRIEYPDGRQAAGVLVYGQGEILTAGHTLLAPGRAARVQLADGTWLAAKTAGISREFDVGLLRIEPPGSYRGLEPITPGDWPQDRIYFALRCPLGSAEFEPPTGDMVTIRRLFRSTVWTDLAADEWLAGGPLINRDGNLIGIQSRESRFGGVLCSRFHELMPHFQRLRNGEVFGAWPPGTEPVLGFIGKGTLAGFELKAVVADSPAAAAGLQVGDIVVRLDGRPIVGDDDLQQAIAERDAGHEAVVDYTRGGTAMQARVKLAPRVP